MRLSDLSTSKQVFVLSSYSRRNVAHFQVLKMVCVSPCRHPLALACMSKAMHHFLHSHKLSYPCISALARIYRPSDHMFCGV